MNTQPKPSPWNAFCGVWRATYPSFITPTRLIVLASLLAGFGFVLYAFPIRPGREPWRNLSEFWVAFAVPIIAFISGSGAARDEMREAASNYYFTRPLPRPLFVVFRYLAQLVSLQVGCLLGLGLLFAMASTRGTAGPDIVRTAFQWFAVAQVFVIPAFAAFGFFCATLTGRYLIIGFVYGALVEAALGNTSIQISQISMLKHARALFELGLRADETTNTLTEMGYLVGFAVLMIALASYIFSQKQFAGGARES